MGSPYTPYRETGMRDFGPYPWWAFCLEKLLINKLFVKKINQKLGGIAGWGVFLYALSSRFGSTTDGIYFWIAFIVGAVLILILGNKEFGKKGIKDASSNGQKI